jgi:hypothetical protein
VRARHALIALVTITATLPALAQPSQRPSDTTCRAYVTDGMAKTNHEEARVLFHAARVRCGNQMSLVLIARSYEQQGDLPRALAYLEAFLAAVSSRDESRAAVEQAAAVLRQHVPPERRVSIAEELAATSATSATDFESAEMRLNRQVEGVDYRAHSSQGVYGVQPAIERRRGLFVGANFAYAPKAKVEVSAGNLDGRVEFPAVFAAEVQAGYRLFPFLSVALAPQMQFNLKPNNQDAAEELGIFVPATGHFAFRTRWDFNLFVAPGYTVLFTPDADDAKGFAFRYGGGPMFHVTDHVSFAAELSHQLGFQKTPGDMDMKTSFFSVLAGIRFRP